MLAVLEVKEPIYGDRPNKSGKNVSIIGAVESQRYDGSAGGSLMGATDVLTFEYCEGQYNTCNFIKQLT